MLKNPPRALWPYTPWQNNIVLYELAVVQSYSSWHANINTNVPAVLVYMRKAQLVHKEMWWNSSLLATDGSNLIFDVHPYYILLFMRYWICSPTEPIGWSSKCFDWYSGVCGWVSAGSPTVLTEVFIVLCSPSRQLLEAMTDSFHILSNSLPVSLTVPDM
jgi:hypothetical protein